MQVVNKVTTCPELAGRFPSLRLASRICLEEIFDLVLCFLDGLSVPMERFLILIFHFQYSKLELFLQQNQEIVHIGILDLE